MYRPGVILAYRLGQPLEVWQELQPLSDRVADALRRKALLEKFV